MLKTNSKKAMGNIMDYIRENTEECFYNEYDPKWYEGFDLKDDDELCVCVYNLFKIEKRYCNDWKNTSEYQIFEDWMKGLPMYFSYHYHPTAVSDLGDILEETEQERSRYTEREAENTLTYLIYRELKKHVNKYNSRRTK